MEEFSSGVVAVFKGGQRKVSLLVVSAVQAEHGFAGVGDGASVGCKGLSVIDHHPVQWVPPLAKDQGRRRSASFRD